MISDHVLRKYQSEIFDVIESGKYKKVISIMPRRAGKDLTALKICYSECLKKKSNIYYICHDYHVARFLLKEYFNKEVTGIKNIDEDNLIIEFENGSEITFLAAIYYGKFKINKPTGIVFAEFGLHRNKQIYYSLQDQLEDNNAWVLLISTPRGKNEFFDIYNKAKNSDEWYCSCVNVIDTKHIRLESIQKEMDSEILEDKYIKQEYFCEFLDSTSSSGIKSNIRLPSLVILSHITFFAWL